MYNQVIKLIKQNTTTNIYGDQEVTETERTVFCEVMSIGTNEFYQAQATNLRPEVKFVLPDVLDYEDEKLVKFAKFGDVEETYSVIRTYQNGLELELTCRRGVEE